MMLLPHKVQSKLVVPFLLNEGNSQRYVRLSENIYQSEFVNEGPQVLSVVPVVLDGWMIMMMDEDIFMQFMEYSTGTIDVNKCNLKKK